MRNHVLLLPSLLLFVSLCHSLAWIRPLSLDVVHADYIHVDVGLPGKHARLKLDASLDHIYLLGSLRSSSNSYLISQEASLEHPDCKFGSEIFTLAGDTRIRLDVLYDCSPPAHSEAYLRSVMYHGVLGLGPRSPLWLHWNRITLTSWTLYLGEHALHQSLFPTASIPMTPRGTPLTVRDPQNGKNYSLQLLPSSPFSYIEEEGRQRRLHLVHSESGQPALHLYPSSDFQTLDAAGQSRSIIKPLHLLQPQPGGEENNNTTLLIGSWAWRHSLLLLEARGSQKLWSVVPAFCTFEATDPPSCILFLASLLLSILFIFWLFSAYAHDVRSMEACLLRPGVKAALLVLTLSILTAHSLAYAGSRLLNAHLQRDAARAYGLLLLLLFGALILDSFLLLHWYFSEGSPKLLPQNRLLLDSLVLLSLWLAILEHIPSNNSRSSLLVVALFLTVVNLTKLYEALSLSCSPLYLIHYSLLTVGSASFLLFWNLEPLIHAHFRYSALHGSAYLATLVITLFTSFYAYSLTTLNRQKHALVLLHTALDNDG